jgi:hypothetical protein
MVSRHAPVPIAQRNSGPSGQRRDIKRRMLTGRVLT